MIIKYNKTAFLLLCLAVNLISLHRNCKASVRISNSVPTYKYTQKLGQSRSMDGVLANFDGDGDLDAVLGHWGVDNVSVRRTTSAAF